MKFKLVLACSATVVLLIVFLFPFRANAQVPTPFGGQIVAITPCLYPFAGYNVVVGPPAGGSYIYQAGLTLSYDFGPPVHTGQWLLGMAFTGVWCATTVSHGDWGGWKFGGLMLFHGSSL